MSRTEVLDGRTKFKPRRAPEEPDAQLMDLAIDITSSCRVRVLLVPVSPIKKSKFWKHVELVKKFNVIRLGDVTPNMQKGSDAMFSSQAFQEGQMRFQFLTSYKRDHVHLEDFQPHRRIFGVIGIMDCQEWRDRDLGEGYQHFVQTLDKYPTAIATRCFAFDPTENQPDDTKGLIMIPNVGEMSFYMSTMICDFASEILSQFEIIAGRIKQLEALESPTLSSIALQRQDVFKKVAPQPSSSSPSSGGQPYRASQPPMPTQSTSSSFLKRAATTTSNTSSSGYRSPQSSMSRSTSAQGISPDAGKIKRCTPGRVQKLLADFFLLAGRLPDAVRLYTQAIEMAKALGDYLWLASAVEGLACASLLMEYLQVNVGDIIPRSQPLPPSNASDSSESTTSTPPSESKSTLTDMLEHYTMVISQYNRSSSLGLSVPGIVYAEACAKMARFLLTVYLHGGWNDQVLSLLVRGILSDEPLPQTSPGLWDPIAVEKYKQSNMPRYEIARWAMKIWEARLDDFSALDQVNLMTHMATVLSAVGYQRKAGWLLHESVHRMLPLLIQSRATLASSRDQAKRNIGKSDTGVLDILKHICEVYGIGERVVQDGGIMSEAEEGGVSNALQNEQPRFGWPDLQIVVLRQCIAISEALPDYASMHYYTTVLLKNLYQYISKEEQIRLASSIQRIVAIGKRSGQVESSVNYWGVNIVSSIEASEPISRKAVYEHPIQSNDVAAMAKEPGTSDPFIYNPFAQEKEEKYKINLVKNEACEFKVNLTNPFAFDLELQNITLSTSGVPFTATSASAIIPESGTLTLHLTGTPEEAGVLTVRGCVIKIVGFAEQEFLVDLQQNAKRDPKEPVKGKRENKESVVKLKRSGLGAIRSIQTRSNSKEAPTAPEFHTLNVIDDQPLLKIQSTSLLHGAIMLYEGEMTQMSLKLENIGTIPVDLITLSFTDSTGFSVIARDSMSMERQYEIGLYVKGTRVFSWEGSGKDAAESIGKKVWLPPGEGMEIIVNVYGKRGCTGGTIQVDYGYLDRVIHQGVDDTLPSPPAEEPIRPPMATTFYTRQLYLPVQVTVYQNLEPLNWDVLYLRPNVLLSQDEIDAALQQLQGSAEPKAEQPIENLLTITRQVHNKQDKNDYCLVTLDVRNTWTVPFEVEFSVDNGDDSDQATSPIISSLLIQPGWTKRMVLPVKRLFLKPEAYLAPIPSFEPNKQFVVSQAPKPPPGQERAMLQMFWYRETLLHRLKATWRCPSTGRRGLVHLRPSLRLSALQLSILKKEDIAFLVDVEGAKSVGHRQFACECNTFVTMKVVVHNRQARPIKLILRIQPVQSYNEGVKEYDLSDKLLMHGFPQVVLQEVPADGTATHTLPLCFLSRGRFEFLYHVEDVHTREVHYDHDWAIVEVEKAEAA